MDASNISLGAMLSQEVEREEQQIVYLSQKLFPWEMAYLVIEKQALALKWTTETLFYYLWEQPLHLMTAHAPSCGWTL